MSEEPKIKISADNVRELYGLLEELNDLFHQPLYYENNEAVKKFADTHYSAIKKAYYETLWDLLPQADRDRIENS